jgi:hypothetical protein
MSFTPHTGHHRVPPGSGVSIASAQPRQPILRLADLRNRDRSTPSAGPSAGNRSGRAAGQRLQSTKRNFQRSGRRDTGLRTREPGPTATRVIPAAPSPGGHFSQPPQAYLARREPSPRRTSAPRCAATTETRSEGAWPGDSGRSARPRDRSPSGRRPRWPRHTGAGGGRTDRVGAQWPGLPKIPLNRGPAAVRHRPVVVAQRYIWLGLGGCR